MQSVTPPVNPYEVVCTRCKVTFPVGTRSCMHCGQPIGRAPARTPTLRGPAPIEAEPDDDLPTRSMAFSPMTFVWLLAAIATVIYRSCQS
jgi:hypothetical protein